jgi:GxxExxY protein
VELNKISSLIIKSAIKVHKELGPGLLESVYQVCMGIEINRLGLAVRSEVPVPLYYLGEKVHEEGFRMDLLVEDQVIVELKTVEEVKSIHKKQLLTYLKLAGKLLGLLINFNENLLKNGITRIINALPNSGDSISHKVSRVQQG